MSTVIDTLIYDRTQEDADTVNELREKIVAGTATTAEVTEYLTDLKGAYNYSDLNRVCEAAVYIAAQLATLGISCEVSPKTDWTEDDTPTASDMSDYLDIIRKLRGMLTLGSDTPDCPDSMENLTWESANAIEQILADMDSIISGIQAAWFYSGEIYAGEAV